jgi:hypothetical protein
VLLNENDVETVVLLSKGTMSSKHIQVEFDLEKMDTSGFKDGATVG